MRMRKSAYIVFLLLILFSSHANAWDCLTHAYIAKKAGIRIPEAACLPDIIRDENYELLAPMHYHNASPIHFIKNAVKMSVFLVKLTKLFVFSFEKLNDFFFFHGTPPKMFFKFYNKNKKICYNFFHCLKSNFHGG